MKLNKASKSLSDLAAQLRSERENHVEALARHQAEIARIDNELPRVEAALEVLTGNKIAVRALPPPHESPPGVFVPLEVLEETNNIRLDIQPAERRAGHERIPIDVAPPEFPDEEPVGDEPPPDDDAPPEEPAPEPEAPPVAAVLADLPEDHPDLPKPRRKLKLNPLATADVSDRVRSLLNLMPVGQDIAPHDLVDGAVKAGLVSPTVAPARSIRMTLYGVSNRGIITRIGTGQDERFRREA